MGNDCILCLSLYALLVPSYPPPYPSGHQPHSLPVPLQPTLGAPLASSSSVIYTNTHIYTMLLVTVSVSVVHLAADAADRSVRGNQKTICLDETWSSCLSHTVELDGGVSRRQKLGLLVHFIRELNRGHLTKVGPDNLWGFKGCVQTNKSQYLKHKIGCWVSASQNDSYDSSENNSLTFFFSFFNLPFLQLRAG